MQALHDKTGWMSNQKFFQCKLNRTSCGRKKKTDTEDDANVPGDDAPVEGREIPEGQIAVRPMDEEQLNVNGALLRASNSLAALSAGCSFYSISSSRSKQKCFQRLVDHAKKLEWEMVVLVAREAQRQQERHPLAPI